MKPWVATWQAFDILPPGTPEWLMAVFALFFIYFFIIIPSGAFMAIIERKISADFQARVGPNRAGPGGILQPIADSLKLIQKKSSGHHSWRSEVWFLVVLMALYSTIAVLPLSSSTFLLDTDLSALLPFWAALILALGTVLLGVNQDSMQGWLGGVRVSAQALAGAFPALVAILCVGLHSGGLKWSSIVAAQGASPLQWAALNPFCFIAFFVFVSSGLILLSLPPLDAGLSLLDIGGGVTATLSGWRLILFRLGRFYGFFLWCVISVVLFLGAWEVPTALRPRDSLLLLQLTELMVLLIKTFILMSVITWVVCAIPRPRVDQITDFTWRVLSPLALVTLISLSIWRGWTSLL